MRLFILKLTATFALWLCGCSMPAINLPNPPQPVTPSAPQQLELKISVGDGKIVVAGGADVTIKNASTASESVASCDCGCSQDGCQCSRSKASAAPRADTRAGSAPQIVPTQKVYECRNGVCGWYDAPIASKATGKRSAASGAQIRIFVLPGNPASEAMRAALQADDRVEFVTGTPPAIRGVHYWPTAVKPDGSSWTPGGWDSGSLAAFTLWLK